MSLFVSLAFLLWLVRCFAFARRVAFFQLLGGSQLSAPTESCGQREPDSSRSHVPDDLLFDLGQFGVVVPGASSRVPWRIRVGREVRHLNAVFAKVKQLLGRASCRRRRNTSGCISIRGVTTAMDCADCMPQKLNSGSTSRTWPWGFVEQRQQSSCRRCLRCRHAGQREDGGGHVHVAGDGFAGSCRSACSGKRGS